MVLPMCQDTGTAIVMGKRGRHVLTDGRDEEHLSRGVWQAYRDLNLRYSQMAPLTMWDEKNTGSNLPAQIELYAEGDDAYKFMFIAKGGGSANKSFLFQETKAILNPDAMMRFLEEKLRAIGTAACPPYHLAIVIGGTSAEFAVKTAKYASTKYLDTMPTEGSPLGHGFRDVELEQQVLELTRQFGIGAQFGGKYFCHDVRVVRLPRHGASLPVAIAVSCSADRQAMAKITSEGVFLEQLETDPSRYVPDVQEDDLDEDVVRIDLDRPMAEIREELAKYPVKTRVSLSGTLVVARDIAHAKIKERLDAGEPMPQYLRDHAVYYAGPAKTPEGYASRLVRSHHRRAHGHLCGAVPGRGRIVRHARQGEPLRPGHERLQVARRLLPRLDRRPGRQARPGQHQVDGGPGVPRAGHGGGLEDRGRGLPGVHRRGRQGQRLLRRDPQTRTDRGPQAEDQHPVGTPPQRSAAYAYCRGRTRLERPAAAVPRGSERPRMKIRFSLLMSLVVGRAHADSVAVPPIPPSNRI